MLPSATNGRLRISSSQVQGVLKQSDFFRLVPVGYVFLNAQAMCEAEQSIDNLKKHVLRLVNQAVRSAMTAEAAKELNELRERIVCYFTSGFRKEINNGEE